MSVPAPAPPIHTPAVDDGARRLHPWSWLFVLLQQLRQFVLPLLALLVFGGRGDRGDWATFGPLIAVVVMVVASVMQYLTYRYEIRGDGLTIREGWLHRNVREIPYARIHNVVVRQSLLHRVFGVAELRLESAGGSKPEAEMRVLRLDEALALEQRVRHRSSTAADAVAGGATDAPDATTLLALPPSELLRLGLVSNRGTVVVAAAFGLAWQVMPERTMANFITRQAGAVSGYASELHLGWMDVALRGLAVLLLAVLVLRLLSVLLAFVQYHGFRLTEVDRRLTVERGLLSRSRNSVARRRVQAWTLHEGTLQRLLGRRSLHIDTAVAERSDGSGHGEGALRELAPIATPETCDALVRHLLPGAQWPREAWQGVAVRAWWRLFVPEALVVVVATTAATTYFGRIGLLPLLWLPLALLSAVQQARRMGYSLDDRLVAVRGGWWSRHWRFAEIAKLQALRVQRSPIDRAMGTATLFMDTSGAGALAPPLRVRFLPHAQALDLARRLALRMARRRRA